MVATKNNRFFCDKLLNGVDWHQSYYEEESNRKAALKKGLIYEAGINTYRLSIEEKQRILLNNIYGVDIDPIAVEVTKLSLYLKLLENETEESWGLLFSHSDLKMLPDLDQNIQCGNSLIESDFYRNKNLTLFGDDEMRKVNAFDWQKAFPHIFQSGGRKPPGPEGFDVVIGNPPYVLVQGDFRNDDFLEYYRRKFSIASYKVDLYHLFIAQGIDLLSGDGMLGVITPSNYLSNNGVVGLRRKILDETHIVTINNVSGKIFSGSVDTAITILFKGRSKAKSQFVNSRWIRQDQCLETLNSYKFRQNDLKQSHSLLFTVRPDPVVIRKKTFLLGDKYYVNFGMQLRDRHLFPEDVIEKGERKRLTKYHRPCYTGKDIQKWHLKYGELFAYFNRDAKSGGCWDENIHFANPKIIIRQIGQTPICALDTKGYCCLNTVFMVVPKSREDSTEELKYILALLNSRFIGYYWRNHFSDLRQTFPKIKGSYLKQLPIPVIDLSDKKQRQIHDRLVDLVDQMLTTQARRHQAISDSDRQLAEQHIAILDRQIDSLVYELYDLTGEEIGIVEGR
ncbi:MAG: Eco57I restriction-modification methylase domain-containing protein [Planctomycetaceae bacterium]|nr:Eco57I restriction-modification methylase domain-containing protein [Planctomycetaceae bacterium]